ncbi:MAG: DUF5011 domain-containing protein [Campylobacterales bacterium]|nr:DUF5011 domain-containing protein [Campylobacterales bacterium]
MISKKRIVLSSMAAALALSLAGCGSSGGSSSSATAADKTAPVITLSGASTITLTVGDTYTEAGATAMDNVDGSVTVTTSGTVNTAVAGTYTITYTAKDAANNTATLTRTVVVQAATPSTSSSKYVPYPIRTQAQIDAATTLSGSITADMTLDATKLYKIDGLVVIQPVMTIS